MMILIFLVSSFTVSSVSGLEEDLDLPNEGNLFWAVSFLYTSLKDLQYMNLMLFVFLFSNYQYPLGFDLPLT